MPKTSNDSSRDVDGTYGELKERQDALVRLIHEKKEHLKQIESMYRDLNAYRYTRQLQS